MTIKLWTTEPKKIYIWVDDGRWSPWTNTVAYYPLTSLTTYSDMKWFGTPYNFSLLWSGCYFWVNGGVDCANLYGWCLKSLVDSLHQDFTLSWRFYFINTSWYNWLMLHWGNYEHLIWTWYNINYWLALTTWTSIETVTSTTLLWWHHICITKTSWYRSRLYLDWVLFESLARDITLTWDPQIVVWWHPINYQNQDSFTGSVSELILESVARTPTEIANYFDSMKSDYGIS